MDRDIDSGRQPDLERTPSKGPRPVTQRPAGERSPERKLPEAAPSREHELIRTRGYAVRLSPAEVATMRDIGRFRTVAVDDLVRHRYQGKTALMQQDLRALRAQGLVQLRKVWSGPKNGKLAVLVLTKHGKKFLEQTGTEPGQALYSGFVKPAEVRHDAAIFRMYHAEKQKIEKAGGRIQRVVLDFELKRKVYSPLAKAKELPPLDYARRQAEVAEQNGLKVIEGKIPLPDLRIEYQTADGEGARVDLELATGHYHGPALQAKAEAGFKMYAADGSSARLSRVLEEREITASILSL